MNEQIRIFLKWAEEKGWTIQRRQSSKFHLPENIIRRYPNIPEEYIEFIKIIDSCITPDEKGWFICLNDFKGTAESAYKWNEFEDMSIEAAKDDDEWKDEITRFWDEHLPIFLSVRSGYAYFALNIGNDRGSVVAGNEPEFEETEKVCSSFFVFLENIMEGNIAL